ncbi:MAG TPA: hypothetical protein VK625_00170 [Flavitalea sp.]|nr:hypothetical protein [Flavitalea sp.]
MKLLPTITGQYPRKNLRRAAKILQQLEDMGAVIEFTAEEDDITPEDSYMEKESADYVRDQYNSGNPFAWFSGKVTVTYKGMEENDYLGGCSYKSERDFKENSGHYFDMVNTCIEAINKEIASNNEETLKRWIIRKAANLVRPFNIALVRESDLIVSRIKL